MRLEVRRSLAVAMTALAAADIAYQWRAERVDETRYPSPGRLVDIGGRRLHVVDHGGFGTPLVIETGAGTLAMSWNPIIPKLREIGRVITYDRAGYGWSDLGGWRRDGPTVADDLDGLLTATGIDEPVVIVGHSLGGLYARCFAARYPNRVAGLVLVDATHEDAPAAVRAELGLTGVATQIGAVVAQAAIPRGLARAAIDAHLLDGMARKMMGGDSDEEFRLRVSRYLRPAFRRASLAEVAALPATSAYLRRHRDLDSLPLVVITAADPQPGDRSMMARLRPAWVRLQADLAALSTNSLHVTASEGGHFVYLDDPDTVIDAVAKITGRP